MDHDYTTPTAQRLDSPVGDLPAIAKPPKPKRTRLLPKLAEALETRTDGLEETALCESVGAATSGPDLGVYPVPGGLYAGRFEVELETVASWAVRADDLRLKSNGNVAVGEEPRQQALAALADAIEPGQRVRVIHEVRLDSDGRAEYGLRIEGLVVSDRPQAARIAAGQLLSSTRIALATGLPEYGLSKPRAALEPRPAGLQQVWRVVPGAIRVKGQARTRAGFSGDAPVQRDVMQLPLPALTSQSFLDGSVPALLAYGSPIELRLELIGRSQDADVQATIGDIAQQLTMLDLGCLEVHAAGETLGAPSSAQLKTVEEQLARWVRRSSDVYLSATIACEGEVPSTLVGILGRELMQGRVFRLNLVDDASGVDPLDLSNSLIVGSRIPPLLPSPMCLSRLGLRTTFGEVSVRSEGDGMVLGDVKTAVVEYPVRLGPQDRQQHMYLIGETGSGKSTFMLNMILQDHQAGRGAILIDPKGDLVEDVRQRIESARLSEIVDIDFTDIDRMPGLNLLEVRPGDDRELVCNQAVQDLTTILLRRYGSVPESMGPMFFMHMRNAIALLMNDKQQQHTISDLQRLYADPAFTAYLLQNCEDEDVRDFWRGIARPATGETALSSIAPYIINKFTEMTQNPRVRASVSQTHSSFDLREAMDQGRLVLVNLAKGCLNEMDTRFLGMLIASKLATAAASRVTLPAAQRRMFNVYIDEFANCATGSLATLFSESRAYGLTLTVAHQSLGQLPEDVRDAALANTATKVLFRSSASDAQALAMYYDSHYSAQDLTMMPDHHAIVRAKFRGVPTPPFVIRTRAPGAPIAPAGAHRAAPGRVAPVGKAARLQRVHQARGAFLPKLLLDEDLFEGPAAEVLRTQGIKTLADLAKLKGEALEKAIGSIAGVRARMTVRRLLRRLEVHLAA